MSAEHAPIIPIESQAAAPTLSDLVRQRAEYKADAEYIAEQIERIDAALILRLGTVGTHEVDGVKVEVREYSRTDLKWVEEQYPATDYPQLYKTTTAVDAAAVKKQFAPAVLEEHKVRGAKSIVIR